MQTGNASHAALRTLRIFSLSTAATGLSRHSQSSCTEGIRDEGLRPILLIPFCKQLCKRAPLGLHFESFSSGTKASMAVDTSLHISEANVFAEQDCTVEEKYTNQMPQHPESEPSKGTVDLGQACLDKVLERLKDLDNMMQQQSRSLAFLSSQLEAHRQSLNSVLEEFKHLNMGPRCKVQLSSAPPDNEATSDSVDVSASSSMNQVTHPWPEWTHFIRHLRSLPFAKELAQVPEVAGVYTTDDSMSIKRILAKFSKAYEYILDALPMKDLQILAENRCPNDDSRTVASYKRLKDHFWMEKKSAPRGVASSELGTANLRLSDVMRLLYMIAELAKKGGAPDSVKKAILHLSEEIIKLTSVRKHGHIDCSKTFSNSRAVLPTSSREKNWTVQEKRGVQGSYSSTAESLSVSDNWECPRCSYFNQEGKNACVQCNFLRPERSDVNFDTAMAVGFPPANRSDTNVCGEDKKPSFLASMRHMDSLDDNTQALSTEGPPQENRLLDTQEDVFQTPIMCEKEEKVLGLAGARDDSDADDHPDIFDDIFNKGEILPARAGPKCSLSELIRENKKAFSLTRKEREQGTADDHGTKALEPFTDRGQKYDDNVANQRAAAQRAHMQDEPDFESDGKYIRQSSAGRAGSVGKSLAGRVQNEDRRQRTKSMQWYDTDEDAESETEHFVSSKAYGNESSKSNKNKHLDDRPRYSDSKSRSRGGWERRTREDSSSVW